MRHGSRRSPHSKPESHRRIAQVGLFVHLVLMAMPSRAGTAGEQQVDAAGLHDRLQATVGNLPWSRDAGYQLSGEFVFKGIPDEISYRATFIRSGERGLADFSCEDPSRNMRFGFAGRLAWAASPEVTTNVSPARLPFSVRLDFPVLYSELLHILDSHPAAMIDRRGNDVYVRGELESGDTATFFFNVVGYFPRKVTLTNVGPPVSAWLFACLEPDGSASLMPLPPPSADCEIWFSDVADMGKYRYPRRTDFVQHGDVVATFVLESGAPLGESKISWNRPAAMPWLSGLSFSSQPAANRRPIYLPDVETAAFRSRLNRSPWSQWKRTNALGAAWSLYLVRIGALFHNPPSLRLVGYGTAIALVGFAVLMARRRRLYNQRTSFGLFILLVLGCLVVCTAAIASRQLHSAKNRALLCLHTSIRYAITGDPAMCARAKQYLEDLSLPAPTLAEQGKACQAYALAYSLIAQGLGNSDRRGLENALYVYARPVYGALQGWRSNTDEGVVAAAGLGMVGLALDFEPYLRTARDVTAKSLNQQLPGGLHLAGPGPGVQAMDSVANFFYALKKTGYGNFFQDQAFQQYVRTTLQLSSPLGTLPLFGSTSPDDSERGAAFLAKVASQMPAGMGKQCVSVWDRYWTSGRYGAAGVHKLAVHLAQRWFSFYSDPYILFLYDQTLSAGAPPENSAVLGNGQAAVLRSGAGPDSLYLALNAANWGWNPSRRDVLTFDLYGYHTLLLHGAGDAGRVGSSQGASEETAAGNCITLNNESQSVAHCQGISASLLNQPLFDHVRAVADRIYDDGQVRRDVVMVRPDKTHAGYFVLIDEVFTLSDRTTVQWYLHGRGDLSLGVNRISRWISPSFCPPAWRSREATLAACPVGEYDKLGSLGGRLLSRSSLFDSRSETLKIEWTGSRRFCTILFPAAPGIPELPVRVVEEGSSAAIGDSDWISLSLPNRRHAIGPMSHVSEYTLIRNRGSNFPALLMVYGTEFRSGPHFVVSTKPLTLSLDGLRGGMVNTHPDTLLELHSPDVKPGDTFVLDGEPVGPREDGVLSLLLNDAGSHSLARR